MAGYVTLVIGAPDRGKTTLVGAWARDAAATGARIALVDSDTGQSEIGPPGTVGVGWARTDTERPGDLTAAHTVFVGALSPGPAALEHVAATAAAVRWALDRSADGVFVDTPGFVSGPGARRWLAALTLALAPQRLVALARDGELESLCAAVAAAGGASIEVLEPDPRAVRKPPAVRATRRLGRLVKALESSHPLTLPLADVATLGATVGTGAPVPPHLIRWASETLRLPLAYGERADGALALWSRSPARPGWEARSGLVADELGARSVRVLSLPDQIGTFLGLHGRDGRLLSVGRFLDLDAERGALLAEAPAGVTAEKVALAAFGRFRVAADGQFFGDLKPGEL